MTQPSPIARVLSRQPRWLVVVLLVLAAGGVVGLGIATASIVDNPAPPGVTQPDEATAGDHATGPSYTAPLAVSVELRPIVGTPAACDAAPPAIPAPPARGGAGSSVPARSLDGLTCYQLGPPALALDRRTEVTLQGKELELSMPADASRLFGDYTAKHIGEALAVVDRSTVLFAPTINEPIYGGRVRITPSDKPMWSRLTGQ